MENTMRRVVVTGWGHQPVGNTVEACWNSEVRRPRHRPHHSFDTTDYKTRSRPR
ncbi:MAG: hypothetical protein ACLS43_00230 [Evtepia gabavorous]